METTFKRINIIWLLLVAATLLSFESDFLGSAQFVRALILALAFIKVLFVGREFMELRDAPLPLLWGFQIWTILVCAVLIVMTW